jgi:hypothetical protein
LKGAVIDWNKNHPDDQITPEWINKHFRLITVAPMILSNSDDLRLLKKEQEEWGPDLVFLDTLGAIAAGQNLSAFEVGTAIGQRLRRFSQNKDAGYVCDVFVVHHLGKDKEKGATGSQFFMNDTDQTLELTYNQDKECLQIKVTKARGGERNRKVMFGVRRVALPSGAETVCVFPFDKDDPRATPPVEVKKRDVDAERVYKALRSFGSSGTKVEQSPLLERIVGAKEPSESEEQHRETRENWRKNTLRRLVWLPGNKAKGIPGRPGPAYHWVSGVALERPAKPRQPYTFEVPSETVL